LGSVMLMFHYMQQMITAPSPLITLDTLIAGFSLDYFALLVCAVCVLPLIVNEAAQYADTIQGPVNKFCGVLRSMSTGEPVDPIGVRTGDSMQEITVPLNDYIPVYERDRLNRLARERINRRNVERAAVGVERTLERQMTAGA